MTTMIYFKNGENKKLYPLESYVYDCDPWPSDHRAVVTEFAICSNLNIGDINSDGDIDILDVILLVNEILYPTNYYCLFKKSDIDLNEELNILDIIHIVDIIIGSNR